MPIGADAVAAIRAAVARRIAGEPVHRILGFREFYGLRLSLSPETLEPRPDTETLVDAVPPRLRQRPAASAGVCRILDLGTGTGAIALALLAQVPEATALGVDISADALATASRNAGENGLRALPGPSARTGSDHFRRLPCNCRKPSLY
ncbi:MAG: methyltransferase domain-containing protein [Asticcacaulis sp.]|nr:methyltransferase domain-containing protein [Asticcacaulis sp.]